MTCFVYALIDPRDGKAFYIGQSRDPEKRFRVHLRNSQTPASDRCREIRDAGSVARLQILSEHEDHFLAKNEEDRLTEITPGLVNREVPGSRHKHLNYDSAESRARFRSSWRASVKSEAIA